MTTHNRRPNIEVDFESSEFTNAASQIDIVGIVIRCCRFWLSDEESEKGQEAKKGMWD